MFKKVIDTDNDTLLSLLQTTALEAICDVFADVIHPQKIHLDTAKARVPLHQAMDLNFLGILKAVEERDLLLVFKALFDENTPPTFNDLKITVRRCALDDLLEVERYLEEMKFNLSEKSVELIKQRKNVLRET